MIKPAGTLGGMARTPCVSVIIPTFNRAAYLDAALQSVLDQTFDDFEIIVIDDGSTDATRDVVARYRGRIRYLFLRRRGLAGATRNRGIRAARGAYIAFLDSDDLWTPTKLARQVAYAAAHPELGLITCDAWSFLDETGQDLYRCYHVVPPGWGWVGPELLQQIFLLQTSSVLIKRTVLEDVGLFEEAQALRVGEDWDLWLRIAARYQIGIVMEPLARIRLHGGNISRQIDPVQGLEHGLFLIERACAWAPAVYGPFRRRAILAQYKRAISTLVAHGRKAEARTLFTQAARCYERSTT